VLWFVGRKLAEQWAVFRNTPLVVEPRWTMIVLSAAIMLGAFVVLIETWRRIIIAWGDTLGFADAARIWFVSNLVRYAPGSTLVQLGAMAMLSRRQRISATAATGASVINVAVNIATGFIIALIAGYGALDVMSGGYAKIGVVVAIAMLIGILALPALLPPILSAVEARTGARLVAGRLPVSAIYVALVGNLIAWTLYGLSYRALVAGVIGSATGSMAQYVAVYAGAYVLGYLVFFLPAGAGVRESVQVTALPLLHLATGPQAVLISVSARLLSMVLEIVPGLLFFSRGTRSRSMTAVHGETPTGGAQRPGPEQPNDLTEGNGSKS
jgi:hypothetical protein